MHQQRQGMYTNRHIASAHKLIGGLNDEDPTFKSRLKNVVSSYNFQLVMVVLVILDCIMVLGEMVIEMQMGNCHGGGGDHHQQVVSHATKSITDAFTTMMSTLTTERPDPVTEDMYVAESAQVVVESPSLFEPCDHVHLLHKIEMYFHLTSIFILFTFNVELGLRLYIFGYKYFLHLENALDAIVVIVSFWLDVAFLDSGMKKYLYLLIILRLWRVLRIIHAIIHAIKTPFERQIEKLKKKRKILQRDLAKAYFYSNMLEEEITALRNRIADMTEAAKREAEADAVTVDDEEGEEDDEDTDEGTASAAGDNTKSDVNNNNHNHHKGDHK
ncbi:PREDICTED: voltage-gated hydrogen channel 1-like [Rhagoletis zephyria]|uniref:voltage-gated hydrogen channel 1-like n=1 Tax=Rhagoletis zephyria TaxID=28612 RepID=UPI00081195B4|nr:PREDICTED: voltage-gated hydrogen channel 1-like [Rhagoletis zephyria]